MNEISTSFDSAKLNINSTLAKFSEIYSPSDVKNLSDKNKYHDNISLIQKDLLQSTSMLLDVICHSTIKINTAMSAQISSIAAISKSTKDIERILKNEEVISQREKFTSSRLIDAKSATIIRIKSFNLELEPSKNNKPNIQPLDFHLYDRIGVLPRTNAQADNPYQVKKMSLKSVDENERESVFKRSTSQDFSNIVGSQSSLKAKSNSKTKLNDSVGSMSSLLKKAIRPMSQAPIRKEVVLEKVALTSRSRSSSIARNESFKRGEMSSLPPPPPPLPSISNFQSSASKSSIKNLDSSNKEIYNLDISTNRKHSFLDEIRNSKVSSLKPVRDSILEEMKFQDNTRVEKYVMRETSTTESFINQMKESSEFLDQLKEKQSIRKLSLSNSIQFDAEKKRRSSVNEAPDFMSEWKLKKSQSIRKSGEIPPSSRGSQTRNSIDSKPTVQSPVDDKPVETAARQSVVEALVVQESTVEATVQEQVFENPVVEALVLGLVVEAPIVQESAVEATVKEQVFETQVVAEKVVEAAFTRESIIEDRVVVENPKAQESVIVETAITQASVAEIVTSQELVVESTAQEQVVETPVFEAPLVEEPIIEPQKVTYESTIESAIQPSNEDTPKSNETQEIIETEEMVISRIIPKRSPSRSRSPSNRKSRMGALGVEGKYSGTSTPTLQEERSSINADPRIKDSGNLEEQNEKIESVILKLESRKNSTESDPVESMNQNIENPLKLDRKNSDPAPELIKTASTEFETSIVETQGKKIVTEIKITTYELDNASPSIDQVNTIEKAVTQDPTDNENPDQVVQEETGNAEEDQRIMAVVLADFESQGEESEFGNGWSFGERMDGSDSGVFPSTYVHVIQQ